MSERELTHLDDEGRARMVDVSGKEVTARSAVAEGRIVMATETLQSIRDGRTPKGDPLLVAELAGIMGGKRTAELIPLCHALPGTSIRVQLELSDEPPGVLARAEATLSGQTGVEMEALAAVSIALLTVYDMVKAVDRGMRIEGIRLLSKGGGRAGQWSARE
jgi:cyclic pyranopterin phosphate synthase